MSRLHGAEVRADEPALEQRNRLITGLPSVPIATFGLGLDRGIAHALAEALTIGAGVAVGGDMGLDGASPSIKRSPTLVSSLSA